MHTERGAIELGFYVEVAPATSAHMLACFRMGLFDTNDVSTSIEDLGFKRQPPQISGSKAQP
ncbi:hypothetical protein DIPPA_28734 [Diplonema papillatum]|nr:hypothetical protein DIPPA_28734 [Diplonema papillatum]